MTAAQLLAWFNQPMKDLERESKAHRVEIDTLRLLRDALTKKAAQK
jgi:hypothetical protein